MAYTPYYSSLVLLVFFLTGLAIFLGGVVAATAVLLRRFELARVVTLGALALATLYGVTLLAVSLLSSEQVLAQGEKKYFCEVDCHLAYSVEEVEATPVLGSAQAGGTFYIVTVKTWFDETTVSDGRGGRPLEPNFRSVAIRDAQGRDFRPSYEGQRALDRMEEHNQTFMHPVRPGESFLTRVVFDLPADVSQPRLSLITAKPETLFIIGHESSLFHKKITFHLEPSLVQ